MSAPIYDKCLCQNCAAVRWIPRIHLDSNIDPGDRMCDCGGDICWCAACAACAAALEAGERDPDRLAELGLRGRFERWSPVTGIR